MTWVIQHPNGEYVSEICNEKRGYIRTVPFQHLAHRYNRQTARAMINRYAPGWVAINVINGKTYQRAR